MGGRVASQASSTATRKARRPTSSRLARRSEGPINDVMDVPGFQRYCAWIDGQLVGTATLRLDDGLAQLCGAATLPAWRRRGVQTALLQRRLADAADAGCEIALMTTSPGTKSQENGLKQGFSLLYVRALLVKDRC